MTARSDRDGAKNNNSRKWAGYISEAIQIPTNLRRETTLEPLYVLSGRGRPCGLHRRAGWEAKPRITHALLMTSSGTTSSDFLPGEGRDSASPSLSNPTGTISKN